MTTTEYLEHLKKYYDGREGQKYPCSNQIVKKIFFVLEYDKVAKDYIESIGG